MEFKDILAQLMDKKGVKPYRISEDTIVSKHQIARYLKGETKPSMDQIIDLSRYFNVSIDKLLTGNDGQEVTDLLRENREFRAKIDLLEAELADLKKATQPAIDWYKRCIGCERRCCRVSVVQLIPKEVKI